jgi:2,3-bisphosphoglycerate-dependent phosphoglycerate mutase
LEDLRHPRHDPRYKHLLPNQLPEAECLKDTVERVIPYWNKVITPMLKSGQSVLIVAHGNSLRALVKHLDHISDSEIVDLNIPTGIPLVYELDEQLQPIRHYYLGDEARIQTAIQTVANQAKAKN